MNNTSSQSNEFENIHNSSENEKIHNESEYLHEQIETPEQAIENLNTTAEEMTQPVEITSSEKNEVEQLGGSVEGVQEVVADIDEKIQETDQEIKEVASSAAQEISSDQSGEGSIENTGETKDPKESKFVELEQRYAMQEVVSSEYSMEHAKEELDKVYSNPDEVNAILEKLPKEAIDEIISDQYSLAANGYKNWLNAVGGKIGALSSERIGVYNSEGVVTGSAATNTMDYLSVVANAARFVPKNVSEQFVNDVVENFTDEGKGNSSGNVRFISANPKNLAIMRNLVEAGYADKAKDILTSQVKATNGQTIGDVMQYVKQGLFTREEAKEILDQAGVLEDKAPAQEDQSNGWG